MLGGPKELNNEQVQGLIDIRNQFKLPGRHPGNLCNELGCAVPKAEPKVEAKSCNCEVKSDKDTNMASIVEEITRRVLKELNK
jgi:L-fuculose-phosphate aldolase